jgi:hypothetical protein
LEIRELRQRSGGRQRDVFGEILFNRVGPA